MRYIFRREEKNPDNFLLWQTKTGKIVECQEKWLTLLWLVIFLVWLILPFEINFGYGYVAGIIALIIVFIVYCARCEALPVERPRQW